MKAVAYLDTKSVVFDTRIRRLFFFFLKTDLHEFWNKMLIVYILLQNLVVEYFLLKTFKEQTDHNRLLSNIPKLNVMH